MMNEKNKIVVIPFLLLVGAVCGYLIGTYAEKKIKALLPPIEIVQTKEVRAGGYEFINPLLECDNFKPIRGGALVNLETELKTYINQVLHDKKAQHVSVYFRDLNNGPWVGINEDEKYSPASLLKVPLAIASFKKAETYPLFLKQLVTYEVPSDAATSPGDTAWLTPGKVYRIDQLIEQMLANADENAMHLVQKNTGDTITDKVMSELGIKKINENGSGDFVSVREYSSMFRLLFNATYLGKDMSEELLGIMCRSKNKSGLVAGVPANIKVSHKFGDLHLGNSATRQLHDCGIIYLPGSPYLLCVMTRGNDQEELSTVISGVSAIVYKQMDAVNPAP